VETFESVRHQLEAARANGQRFRDAWPAALATTSASDREFLEWGRDDWEAAYDLQPAPREIRAFTALAFDNDLTASFDEHAGAAPTPDRRSQIYAEGLSEHEGSYRGRRGRPLSSGWSRTI
jgi:hypothetical protein